MTSPTANQTSARLEATFGLGRGWTSQAGQSATVWETPAYHLVWFDDAASDVELWRLWEARKGRQAYPVVLLAPSEDVHKVRVAGPQDARPVRELPAGRALDLLEASRSMATREAASFLAREFSRLEEAVVPGLRVKDLLTPHFMRERMRRPINEQRLSSVVEGISRLPAALHGAHCSKAWAIKWSSFPSAAICYGTTTRRLVEWAWSTGGWPLAVVRRSPDSHRFEVLPRRWVVERTLTWLSRCRRLSKDYEELPETGETWVHLAMVYLMLKRLKPT